MKKIICLTLSILFILSFATSANASDESCFISEDGNYILRKCYGFAAVEIVKYIGEDNFPDNYIIPRFPESNGIGDVGRILTGAFCNLKTLKHVTYNGSQIEEEEISVVERRAFYNCDNMKSITINSQVCLNPKAVGYSHGKKIKGFEVICDENNASVLEWSVCEASDYAGVCGATAVYSIAEDLKKPADAIARKYYYETTKPKSTYVTKINEFSFGHYLFDGKDTLRDENKGFCSTVQMRVEGKTVNGWKSSNPKAIKITSKGKVTLLKEGKAKLSVKYNGKKITRTFKLRSNPALGKWYVKKNGKGWWGKASPVTVKKGKTVTLRIVGKAKSIDNKYINKDCAKVISPKSAETIKIKGLKKGTATLGIVVNGKKIPLKVTVK